MRRLVRLLGVAAVLGGSALVAAPAGAADAPVVDATGWWWRLQTNPALLLPAPPTVSAEQLLVQGAPDGATAIAALAITLPEGEGDPVLTLDVPEAGATGDDDAVLLACQAGSTWAPGAAQVWGEKPSPACEVGAVAGERSPDGTSWRFALGPLQFEDQVNVVLVPGRVEGRPEGADGSTFSITFDAPTSASIATSAGGVPTTVPTPPSPGAVDPPPAGGSLDLPPVDLPAGGGELGLPPLEAALPDDEQGLTPVAPSVQSATPLLPALAVPDPRSPHARAVGVGLLLAGAAVVYGSARRPALAGAAATTGGLARWVRPREGPPPPLRG